MQDVVKFYHGAFVNLIKKLEKEKGKMTGKDLTLKNSVYPIEKALEELYLPYTFDISIFDKIDNPDLINHINRIGKIFYKKYLNN
jgi:hypothetical protein